MQVRGILGATSFNRPPKGVAADVQTNDIAAHRFDVSQLEFRILFEVKGTEQALSRPVAKVPGWSATTAPGDCSHDKLGDKGHETYVHIASPPLRLASGALDDLTKVIDIVKSHGGSIGPTGAMHIHIPRNVMNDQASANFVKMYVQNEDFLYRLGQQGGVGRQLAHKLGYSNSICDKVSFANNAWYGDLSSHRCGLNTRTHNQWEIRCFDASLDADAVKPSIQLVLGMVGAAVDGRGTSNETSHAPVAASHGTFLNNDIDRKRWNAFMRATVSPEVRRKLEANLRGAGGLLPRSVSDEARHALTQLMSRQYRFEMPSGQPFGTVEAVEDAANDNSAVVVRDPQGHAFNLPGDRFESYVLAETGATKELSEDVRARLAQAIALRGLGVEFSDANGTALSPVQFAILPETTAITATSANESMTVQGADALHTLHAVQSGETAGLSQAGREFLAALPALRQNGYSLIDGQRPQTPIAWPAKALNVFQQGRLAVERGGQRQPVPNWNAFVRDVLYPAQLATLSQEQRDLCNDMEALTAKGFQFKLNELPAPGTQTLAFLSVILGDLSKLSVRVPNAQNDTPLPTPALLATFRDVELGRDSQLGEGTRNQIALIDGLRARGYAFFNRATEDEIHSRSGGPLTLQTEGHRLTMRPPGSKRRTRVNAIALRNVLALESSQPQNMSPMLAEAVRQAAELRAGGFRIQMRDILNAGKFIDCNDAELVATLSRKKPVSVVDPSGQSVIAEGPHQFAAAVQNVQQVTKVPAEQQQTLAACQDLLDSHRLAIRTQPDEHGSAAEVNRASLLPWYFVNQKSVELRSASEPPGQTLSVTVNNFPALARALEYESNPQKVEPQEAAALERFKALRSRGISFHSVAAGKAEPAITLNAAFVDRMAAHDVKARLPRRTMWGWWPSRTVTIRSQQDLETLANKFSKDPVKEGIAS